MVLVSSDGAVIGAIALADTGPTDRGTAVADLRRSGCAASCCPGTTRPPLRSVAVSIGITEVIAGAMPAEKVEFVRRLQADGHSVAMVGDGVNDAPALVAADLGLAVGSGTDVALNAADLIIVRDDLRVVATAIGLARRTMSTIRGNFPWAFGYNVAAIPLAALRPPQPTHRGGAMAFSSAFVVWNSARLRHFADPVLRDVPGESAEDGSNDLQLTA